jgi:hypothetical protein
MTKRDSTEPRELHEFLGLELRSPAGLLGQFTDFVSWLFTCFEYAIVVGGVSAAAKIGAFPAANALASGLQILLMMFIYVSVHQRMLHTSARWRGQRWLVRIAFEATAIFLPAIFVILALMISSAITSAVQ